MSAGDATPRRFGTGSVGELTDLRDLVDRVLGLVPAGVDAQVVAEQRSHGLTRFAGSRIHQNLEQETLAVTLKLADSGRVATASTNRTGPGDLEDLVDRARLAASVRPVDPGWPGVTGAQPVPSLDHWDERTAAATPEQRAAVVAGFLAAGRAGQDGAGYCDTVETRAAVGTSRGQRAAGRSTRATVDGIFLTAPEGGHTPAGSGHATSARLADLDGGRVGSRAARLCADSRGATDVPPAAYPVVLMPECVAEVVAFLSDGFSAKAVQDGRSFAAPGRALFDPAFELVDDVAHPASLGLAFDTDGVARQRVELSRGGRCEGLLHDRRTAAHDDRADGSNGHAHHGSDSAGPGPAALVVTPGRASAEQLVAGLDRGLVVTCFNYCRVLDPKTMEVTGLTRNGTFWVESGEIVRPVTNLRFTQSFLEALRPGAVLAVGADARLADCEWGTGLVHTPALRLASWRFTGGAAG